MTLKLVQSRVDLTIVELLRALANRFEHQRFRISCGINAKDIENDGRCRPFITTANDVPITNDENKLPLVVTVQTSKGVNCATKRVLSFCATRNLVQYEFIQQLGEALGIELKRSKDCIELAIYIVDVEGDVHFNTVVELLDTIVEERLRNSLFLLIIGEVAHGILQRKLLATHCPP